MMMHRLKPGFGTTKKMGQWGRILCIIFESLRKSIMRRLKTNVLNRLIYCMNFIHGVSVGEYSDEKESERYTNFAVGLDALIRVGKA